MAELLTAAELAKELSVTTRTLQRWRDDGTGPKWVKAGDHYRYTREAVDTWLDPKAEKEE